ncbi:carbohydrate porin [Kosakonia radicincitans]|uniref:carbohydrate porin n=1 Tax=Kosakonia radicincitans TaxID=283686 RepID=UPI0008B65527|nr:carbohydrate porin [Kosakonia radicincitans]APG19531.1 porin [Kosakonia radicincitans]MDD7995429.1 carbohydrate porin [Kosakonia radicincitans]SET63477.1 porin [Kosakonia radicincitans]SKC17422.1 porin, OprB family [Kosakonia radicincitans]
MKHIKTVVKQPVISALAGALFLCLQPSLAHAADAFSADSPWMFGDWGGTRTELQKEGVDFQVNYTMEAASNLAGGYNTSTTARYSDQQVFGVNLDLQKLLNWQDAEFQLTITNRDGQNVADQVADPRTGMLSSPQEVYGRGQTWRLTQFWLRKGFFDDVLDVKAGRVTVGEDFDNFDSKFQNLAFGSGQAGNWRGDHWYNWPVSQWGGRVRINFTPEVFMQVGFYNQNPYNYDRGDGFRFEFNPTEGNLVPVELGWKPLLGADKLPGNYRLGYYYSSTNDNVYGSWRDGSYQDTAHSYGGYILAQQQLTAQGGSSDRGITLTVQAVMNDHKTSKTDNYQSIALTWKGPFDARPQDEIGIGAGRIHINSSYTRLLDDENRFNGETDYNSLAYLPIQDGSEYDYEIYYNIQATKWLQIRPNLQYISAPGAVSQVDDAFVGGVTANINF